MTGLRRTDAAPEVRQVHLGLGSFFRSHQAWYTHHAPDAAGWGVAAFTGRSSDRSDRLAGALQAQDGLYTLVTRAATGDQQEVVTSLAAIQRFADHTGWLARLTDPRVAVLTTTITEAGYLRGPDGGFDATSARARADLEALRADPTSSAVVTAPGKLVAGLAARSASDAGPLTVVPCDNLPGNGAAAAGVLHDLADRVDARVADWVRQNVTFVTTMVDRITPEPTAADLATVRAATGVEDRAPVVTEPFSEWVLAGPFAAGRPAWDDAGATLADDIEPFEQRKLWMLNGAHSTLAYAGSIRGHATVSEAMRDGTCREWLEEWWDCAARHLRLPAADNDAYRSALVDRFGNPRLQHRLEQIAWDGSLKLPIRVLPVLAQERAAGRLPPGATRPLAAWVSHLRGHGAKVTDARAAELGALSAGPVDEAVRRLLGALDPEVGASDDVVAVVAEQAAAFERG